MYFWDSRKYTSAWNTNVRDIDLSFIIRDDSYIESSIHFTEWIKKLNWYDLKSSSEKNADWIKSERSLPNYKDLIEIADDANDSWILLKWSFDWQDQLSPENERFDLPFRKMWMIPSSYIIKTEDYDRLIWLLNKLKCPRWKFPESHSFHDFFLWEYPYSDAYDDIRWKYPTWEIMHKFSDVDKIKCIVTDDNYLNEFTRDHSYKNWSIGIRMLSKWIIDSLWLINCHDWRFINHSWRLIATNTNIFKESDYNGLMIRKESLLTLLKQNDCKIIWTIMWEKNIMWWKYGMDEWAGRLNIDGYYTFTESRIFTKFEK